MTRKEQVQLAVYTDGAARKNPGPSALGFVVYQIPEQKLLAKKSKYLGRKTNNQAEYLAVIAALNYCKRYPDASINIYSDSQLVVNQLNKAWKIRNQQLGEYARVIENLNANFAHVGFNYVPRTTKQIQIADALCNAEMDKHA